MEAPAYVRTARYAPDNITFQHLFIIIKCPAELNFDCKILIRSVPSTFVTELLLRGYVF